MLAIGEKTLSALKLEEIQGNNCELAPTLELIDIV